MDKLLLELILNDIIKDDTLKFDKGSGLYYVNNRVDNSFLIEYDQVKGIMYMNDIIIDYIHANDFKIVGNLNSTIIEVFNTMYTMGIKELFFYKTSVINKKKFEILQERFNNEVLKDIINIPDLFDYTKLELELCTHDNYDENKVRNLKSRKVILDVFKKIDISDMCSGFYNLFIYTKEIKDSRKVQFHINNKIKI